MDFIAQLALASGLAWASGIRLYAVVFFVGMLGRYDVVALPGDLAVLEHEWVLWASGVMLVGEFVADKVPVFDSFWDALQTFVRVPGGAALAYAALGDQGPAAQVAAAIIGGSIVTGTHLTKAATRATINHSPEPFSNWLASFAEDGIVLAGLWLALQHPIVFLVLLVVFLALVIWLLPKLWRALRAVFRRLRGDVSADRSPADLRSRP
jgi:hypothetical protein